jgi:hypothetical protein
MNKVSRLAEMTFNSMSLGDKHSDARRLQAVCNGLNIESLN